MKQDIRFCTTPDGVKIAFAKSGSGPVLVKAANWLSHLEYELESPVWRHWIRELSRYHTLVRYDERGCGLSDWDVKDFSFDKWIQDLETVVDTLHLERFPLLGISQGGPVAIAYAVKHPEKVSHLILYGSYAQGRMRRNFLPHESEQHAALTTLIKVGWGQANPAFRQLFGNLFMPEASPELLKSFEELQRISTSSENAGRFHETFGNINVENLLSSVDVPTLILHSKDDARIPIDASRQLATMIPGSKFVLLNSKNHILLENEPAWQRFLGEIYEFLGIKIETAIASSFRDTSWTPPGEINEGRMIKHYKILQKLGEGGMSVVYKAEDIKLERTVAIKFLPRHIASNSDERERFKIEAKAAASLSHSNIATIHAIEETDNEIFISMEYIDGLELKDKIKSGQIPDDEIINITLQIAEGLEAAHNKGIVHRDIKSQNIMITGDGKVKVMDFGLAKIMGTSPLTKTGTTMGTVSYMSPEQAMGKELDQKTDIWSFGVVLYEMITGQLPFKGDYDQAVIYAILHEEPVPPGNLRDNLPKALEQIILKALSKEPAQRFQNISEMLFALKKPTEVVPYQYKSEDKKSNLKRHRKLAAIMFTDMVGYSALTQKNETLAIELLQIHKELVRNIFPKHGGKEIETIGDAFFIEFDSALDAANCAIEIQKTMHERNLQVEENEKILLRIGLHVGDVIHVGDQVHGDGVNITARLEPLAPPGGICLSEDVARQIQNKIELPINKVGTKKLKNIDSPINVYNIQLPWEKESRKYPRSGKRKFILKRNLITSVIIVIFVIATLYFLKSSEETAPGEISNRIAVLPLINISQSSTDDYFADGMTEELISQLAKISSLNVIARTSVMKYKNTEKNIVEIGNELDVGTMLEGSVRIAFDKARVSVKLINAETQKNIWTQIYDRKIEDLFTIQSDIALSIANQLKIQLLTDEKEQLEKKGTENSEAYRSYLLGKYQLNLRTPESVYMGVEYFSKAIEHDPSFALAYVGLTDCYTLIGGAGYGYLPIKDAIKKANDAINKALEIDPSLPEAYNTLAYLKFRLEWNWEEAEIYFKKAIDLQPGLAEAYERYALYLACLGKHSESIQSMQKAYQLDPLSPSVSTGVGRMYHFDHQFDKAIEQYKKTLKMNPDYVEAEFAIGLSYAQKGMYKESVSNLKRAIDLSNGRLIIIAALGYIHVLAGNKEDALKIRKELEELQSEKEVSPFYFAIIDAALGNKAAAIDSLYKSYDQHFGILVYLTASPFFDNLKNENKYNDLLEKIGLVDN